MPLRITDETAGVLLLVIDDAGLICFGNGTPVTQLTINGIGVVDSDGYIVNQRAGSSSIAPSSGSVTVAPGFSVTLNTLPGIVPTVQLDSFWPNIKTEYLQDPFIHCQSTSLYSTPTHSLHPGTYDPSNTPGSFTVYNLTQPDEMSQCPTGISDTVNYRWM